MRHFCRCVLLLLCCLPACSAWATRIIIQDPTEVPITTSPSPVAFTNSCMDDLTPNFAGYGDAGCFAFVNRTASDWTGVTLELTAGTPTGDAFECPTAGVDSVFATTSCSFDAATGRGVLSFSDGLIPNDTTQYFVISENDLPPGSLTFELYPTFASTPEPSGIVLLGTGLLCAGVFFSKRSRVHA